MMNYHTYYAPVLSRAVEICDQLRAFLEKEQAIGKGRLASAIAEIEAVRSGILERLATPRYLAPSAFSSVAGFMTFYDNHASNSYGVSLSVEICAYRDHLMDSWIREVVEPLVKLMNQLQNNVT